jgi:hypothetical protein
MRSFKIVSLIFFLFSHSQYALAVFDGQIFMGKRTGTFNYAESGSDKSQDISSAEKGAAFHLDPIPMVPVSGGFFFAMNDYQLGDTYKPTLDSAHPSSNIQMNSNLKGNTYGPEIKAWIPLTSFEPYFRASYVMGSYSMDIRADIDNSAASSESSYEYGITGSQFGFGISYSVVPTIGLFAEANFGKYEMKLKKLTTKDIDSTTGYSLEQEFDLNEIDESIRTQSFSNSGVLFGISAGI